jgi:tetratricopeptide (TPR) repeat protein
MKENSMRHPFSVHFAGRLARVAVALLASGVCTIGLAVDAVKTSRATAAIQGEIKEVTALKVVIETRNGPKDVPANEVVYVAFDGEPATLTGARTNVRNKRYEEALTALDKIELDKDSRKELVQDVQFYKALCTAKLALAGTGEVLAAGKLMNGFLTANSTSYHYLEACEVVGDLLVASGKYSAAAGFYSKLAAAPWPDYKMRAGVAMGRALLAERKVPDAQKAFDDVLAGDVKGDEADRQRTMAQLGKARCMAESGKPADAVKIAEEIITKTDSEQIDVQAQAYNTLGTALRLMNKPKEALRAFLHVDLLYNAAGDAHAEALANLAKLWNDVGQPERAVRAKQNLVERYKNSAWAQ